MPDSHFEVAFSGQLVDGAEAERVKENLAKLFKTTPEKLGGLFSGQRVVIKKDLDEAGARKYEAAMRSAGAVAEVVDTAAQAAPTADPAAPQTGRTPAAPASAPAAASAAAATSPDDRRPLSRPNQDTSGLTMAEPGVTLVEPKVVEEPQYDLGDLTLDAPGAVLTRPKQTEEPEIDISGLKLE